MEMSGKQKVLSLKEKLSISSEEGLSLVSPLVLSLVLHQRVVYGESSDDTAQGFFTMKHGI